MAQANSSEQSGPPKGMPGLPVLDPATAVGSVTLAVADLPGMVRYYREIIGLALLAQDGQGATLGVDGRPLLYLESRPVGRRYSRAAGLYHLALLLPTRADLGHWLRHLAETGGRLDGASDHLVSEALYLSDPEGNGIEIYRDRPRDQWPYNGDVPAIDTLPLDLHGILAEAPKTAWNALPVGTTLGHVHLQVADLDRSIAFYEDLLGFDLIARMFGAAFVSTGGYHHHLGMNVWHSQGAAPRPADALGLVRYALALPSAAAREELLRRLHALDVPVADEPAGSTVFDPSGIAVVLAHAG